MKKKDKSVKKSKASLNEVEEPYFEHPHWLKVWHEKLLGAPWMSGMLLAAILVGLSMVAWHVVERLDEPPSIAALLPEDSTVALIEVDRSSWDSLARLPSDFPWNKTDLEARLADRLPDPEAGLPAGVGDHVGIAWIETSSGLESWYFLEAEASQVTTTGWFMDGYWVLGPDASASEQDARLIAVQEGELPSLKDSESFQILRSKLDYNAPFFLYANPSLVTDWQWLDVEFGDQGASLLEGFSSTDRAWMQSLLPTFLAMGAVAELSAEGLTVESAWVGDKAWNQGEALFHLGKKHQGDLLGFIPEQTVRFSSWREGWTQFEQGVRLWDAIDGGGAAWLAYAEQQWASYMGENQPLETWAPLLNEEIVVGFLPESMPFLMAQLTEETLPLFESWVAAVLEHGVVEVDVESGTVTHASLALVSQEMEGVKVNGLERDDGAWLALYAIDESLVLRLASNPSTLQTLLATEGSPVEEAWSQAADFGDQMRVVEAHSHWPGVTSVVAALNLYDDGFSAWYHLDFE